MSKKLTIEECLAVAKENDGECLSSCYINAHTKMEWRCAEGHIWQAKFGHIKDGHWCPFCSGRVSITLQSCIDYARLMGGECLSNLYDNIYSDMKWECKNGHIWTSSFSNLKYKKHWCPYCAGNAKLTIEDCIACAKTKNGKCLSTKYINARTKIEWECSEGHRWLAAIYSIKAGTWCLRCAGLAKHSISDCEKVAAERGGKCLSPQYTNNQELIEWQCSKKHIWSNSFGHVKDGQWCPICCRPGSSQEKLRNIICAIFPLYEIKYNFRGFDWLKTQTNNPPQEIDIYIPKLKLAIEYDGIQHFEPVKYFGGVLKFERQKLLDANKNIKIKEHPQDIKHFIRISYIDEITTENITSKILNIGIAL